jgi:hypothetical protein
MAATPPAPDAISVSLRSVALAGSAIRSVAAIPFGPSAQQTLSVIVPRG